MERRTKHCAVVGVIFLILASCFATLTHERILHQKVYTILQFYPTYHYTNFTVASSYSNAELSLDLEIDFNDNYANYTIFWVLYHLPLELFEDNFNSTVVHEAMKGGTWEVGDFGAFWAGWFSGMFHFSSWESIPSGAYVFVFWIDLGEPVIGWSATFTALLRTRILQI